MKFKEDKTSISYQLRQAIAKVVNSVQGVALKTVKPEEIHLEHPENEKWGDYSTNIAMKLYNKQELANRNPNGFANNIKKELEKQDLPFIEKIMVVGGFLNISIKNEWLVSQMQRVLEEGEDYGKSTVLQGKKILLEHTSPDPIKTMHVGHLRNNFLGMSMAGIFSSLGAEVVLDCINNDRGTHISQAMIGYLAFGRKNSGVTEQELLNFSIPEEKINKIVEEFEWKKSLKEWVADKDKWFVPKDLDLKPDHFDLRVYSAAAKAVKKHPQLKDQVREVLLAWEAEDKEVWQLWQTIIDWSMEGYKETYRRIGSSHDYVWHESDLYKEGKNLVYEGLKKGIFKKSRGAIVTDLRDYKLPDTVMIKSDGTSLYITFDINLTQQKKKKFPSDFYIWDIGSEQQLYLKQMFAVCEQLGIAKLSELFHFNFGYVYLKGKGKMSSREGTIVSADDLVDLLMKKAREVRLKSKKGKLEKENKEIDTIVGLSALKYAMLKVGRLTDIQFDIEESVSLQGNSGPYLQYTYARTRSVLEKANFQFSIFNFQSIFNDKFSINREELAVLRSLYKFPEVVEQAGKEYAPNLVCNYLYDLAQKYNSFYNKHRILQRPDTRGQMPESNKTNFRLALTGATGQILKNGLGLLGIKVIEKM